MAQLETVAVPSFGRRIIHGLVGGYNPSQTISQPTNHPQVWLNITLLFRNHQPVLDGTRRTTMATTRPTATPTSTEATTTGAMYGSTDGDVQDLNSTNLPNFRQESLGIIVIHSELFIAN